VRDVIGSSVKTAVSHFGWTIPMEYIDRYEERFFQIMNKFMEAMPATAM
jgi:hypothetical protein